MAPEENRASELMQMNRFLFDLKILYDDSLADSYARLKESLVANKEESGFSIEREKAAYFEIIKDLIQFLVDRKEKTGFEKDEFDEFVADLL